MLGVPTGYSWPLFYNVIAGWFVSLCRKQSATQYFQLLSDTVACYLCLSGLPPIPFCWSTVLQNRRISGNIFTVSPLFLLTFCYISSGGKIVGIYLIIIFLFPRLADAHICSSRFMYLWLIIKYFLNLEKLYITCYIVQTALTRKMQMERVN